MKRFTDPVRECIANSLWMPAITTALTLPDICAWLETPTEQSVGKRYKRWAGEWIEPTYTSHIGPDHEKHIFLSASDMYALRCAVAHNGSDDITDQKAKETLDSFVFCYPVGSGSVHCNEMYNKLQLQVDIFCRDICDAVDQWDAKFATDAPIQAQKETLISLRPAGSGL